MRPANRPFNGSVPSGTPVQTGSFGSLSLLNPKLEGEYNFWGTQKALLNGQAAVIAKHLSASKGFI
ncbi:hypothetical protein PC41400_00360 [Paenibacillus chitinolyticus]|uniref:Uncharacterized protein n=1 Tax=Paenibacillus chitinolyticus TaxID=79263 RepID=A0A410WPF6_9BACL|nr:hypothetical protein PC41400_00360 [Paenibacillus chitinolyticus]